MRVPQVPVENIAEIVWGVLLVAYLVGAGRSEYLNPAVLAVFGLSAAAAFVEVYLRRTRWPWLTVYDGIVWTVLLSAMVAVTGGRSSEVWPAYMLMSLTAPSIGRPFYHYGLMAINSLLYAGVYAWINPDDAPFSLALLGLRIGLFFLVTYVVDRSMERERAAMMKAIQATRDRVGELVRARDAERKRIAGDIHDWLGRGIVAPMRKLELAERAPDLDMARSRVGEALESLRRSHEELRRLMENLHPHLLEQMGLAEGLRAYLHLWGDEHDTEVAFRSEPGPEPSADVALVVYRIQQEALNNVAKHARASRVTVRLMLDAEQVTLVVSDDGVGFVPGMARMGGRGLTGMAERAAVVAGGVRVTSQPGEGTTVTAQLPAIPPSAPNPA